MLPSLCSCLKLTRCVEPQLRQAVVPLSDFWSAQVGKGKVVKVTGIENPGRSATVLLRGSNKLVLEVASSPCMQAQSCSLHVTSQHWLRYCIIKQAPGCLVTDPSMQKRPSILLPTCELAVCVGMSVDLMYERMPDACCGRIDRRQSARCMTRCA